MSAIICEHCGDAFTVELLEYWPEDRTFQIVTCCEASHDEQLAELQAKRARRAAKAAAQAAQQQTREQIQAAA